MSQVSKEDAQEIYKLPVSERRKYIVVAKVDFEKNILFFIRGNGIGGAVSLDCFQPTQKETPNFNQVEIIDCGQTVKFGNYEVAADYLIEESQKY